MLFMRQPKTFHDLETFCQEEWAAIPPARMQDLIDNYDKRLHTLIDAKRVITQYYELRVCRLLNRGNFIDFFVAMFGFLIVRENSARNNKFCLITHVFFNKWNIYYQLSKGMQTFEHNCMYALHQWVPSYRHMASPTISTLMTHSSISHFDQMIQR